MNAPFTLAAEAPQHPFPGPFTAEQEARIIELIVKASARLSVIDLRDLSAETSAMLPGTVHAAIKTMEGT